MSLIAQLLRNDMAQDYWIEYNRQMRIATRDL